MGTYIRRRLGGRIDAWDETEEYTRVDEVVHAAGFTDYTYVTVEGRKYLTLRKYLVRLVELTVAPDTSEGHT